MIDNFGTYINNKRKKRGPEGQDILLRDIANAMNNMSVPYLSDILKGHRKPPDKKRLNMLAEILSLSPEETAYMYDLAGKERGEVSSDISDYIMDENIPHVRAVLRNAKNKGLDDVFWEKLYHEMDHIENKNRKEI